jgi:lysozyme
MFRLPDPHYQPIPVMGDEQMTILGIDISKWDGNWDANKAKQAGAAFVIIKASQSVFADAQFSTSWKKAKEAGILRAAYHYLDYTRPAKDQAKFFANLLKNDPGELPPTVDYEQARTDNNPTIALGFLRDFLDQLKSHSELFKAAKIKCPMIYTSSSFWAEYGDQTRREYWLQFPLWIANYTTAAGPSVPAPWTMWNFWQFSSKGPGEVYGSESLSVDMNRFNGTSNELLEFAGLLKPVSTVIEPDQDLAKRTTALEDVVATLKILADGKLITRLDDLEQHVTGLAQSITTSHADLDQRLLLVEHKLASTSTENSRDSTGTSSDSPGPSSADQGNSSSGAGNSSASAELSSADPGNPGGSAGPSSTDSGTSSAGPSDDPAVYATCKANILNVRKAAGASSSVVGYLRLGQRVQVVQRKTGWAQIEQPAGWVYEPYLVYNPNGSNGDISPAASTPADPSPVFYGVCNTSSLNVRNNPGGTNPIVGGLTYGQRVRIIDRRAGWAQIETPAGWCNESYLSFS